MGGAMSSVTISGDTSGSIILQAPAVSGSTTLTLPTTSGTVLTTTSPKAGNVIQVVSTTLTTGFSASVNNSFSAVTGLTATITPSSSSSKIMVFVTMTVGSDGNYVNAQLTRGGTAISGALATAAGSRSLGTSTAWPVQTYGTYGLAFNYLDSPSTTSSTTYGVQIGNANAAALCVNQSQEDSNSAFRTRGTSTIMVMEIAV